jgi:hypothetical protein
MKKCGGRSSDVPRKGMYWEYYLVFIRHFDVMERIKTQGNLNDVFPTTIDKIFPMIQNT